MAVVDGRDRGDRPAVHRRQRRRQVPVAPASCSQPRPSSTSSTTWSASATGAGIHAGSGATARRPSSAGTMPRTFGPGVVREDRARSSRGARVHHLRACPARHAGGRHRRPRRTPYDGAVRVSTRGDYACRALLSLALHADERRADLGARHRRAHRAPPALPRADPPRPEGRRAGALEARRRRRLRARPAARARSRFARSSARSTARSSLGDFGEPHQDGACDHEGQCVLLADLGRRRRADAPPASTAYTLADVAAHGPRRARRGPSRGRHRADRRATDPATLSRARARSSTAGQVGGQRRRERAAARRSPGGRRPARRRAGTAAASVDARRGRRRSGRRRPPDGRWRRGARGSGGCGRSRAGSRAAPARPGSVEASRDLVARCAPAGRRPTTAIRVGSRRSRPIGASMTPCGALGCAPHQRQVARARPCGRRAASTSAVVGVGGAGHDEQARRAACRGGGRCPGRCGSPTPAISGKRASSPLTSVPSGCPAPGCTTRPGRLVDHDHVVVVVDDRHLDGRVGRGRAPARQLARRRPSSVWPALDAQLAAT